MTKRIPVYYYNRNTYWELQQTHHVENLNPVVLSQENEDMFDLVSDGLYIVARRLDLSCGARCAVQSGSLTSVFNANDKYAHANILFSPYPSIQNIATSSKRQQPKWPYVHADGMRLHPEDVGELGTAWIRYEKENKVTCDGCFICIVPEKLRLWDECDWSAAPESLLPFEYGPSSEETAEVLLEM